jgi:hypothetical protein
MVAIALRLRHGKRARSAVEPGMPSVAPIRFVDRVEMLVQRVNYRQAVSPAARELIFRQRYRAYLREGAIEPNESELFTDEYDESPNGVIFGLYIEDRLCASMRVHVASRYCRALPAMWAFADVLDPEFDAGKTIVDPSRFVVDYRASREHPALAYVTARLGWLAGEHYQADIVLSTARAEHHAFYRRVFNYRVMTECRPYKTLKKPLGLLFLDYKIHKKKVESRYPFLRSTEAERDLIFGRTADYDASQRRSTPQSSQHPSPGAAQRRSLLASARYRVPSEQKAAGRR